MLNNSRPKLILSPRLLFAMLLILLVGCANAPAGGVLAQSIATADGSQSRDTIRQEIVQKALAAMAASSDAAAVALSAKHTRLAGVEDGKERSNAEQDKRQAEAMRRSLALAEAITDPAKRNKELSFVRYILANNCLALVNELFCLGQNPMFAYVNNHSANAYGWILFASSEYTQGRNKETQILLTRATNEPELDWYYSRAVDIGRNQARLVVQTVVGAKEFADAEAAALTIAGELTMPPFQRFSQMCNPDPAGKLPDGRYEACRKLANRMINSGKTNIEVIVGLRAMERMALGEKNEAEARIHSERLAKLQEGIDLLWKTALKFPPTNAQEAGDFASYVNDLITVGERQATETMQQKYSIGADKK